MPSLTPEASALRSQLRRELDVHLAPIHPGLLLQHVHCIDNTTGDRFRFHFSPEQLIRWASTPNQVSGIAIPEAKARMLFDEPYEETGWEWQGDLIDWWLDSDITLILKARQLGITWCAAGVALWYLTQRPGSRVLVQSKNEDDAADLVDHVWEMWLSLGQREDPDTGEIYDLTHLRRGAKVQTPARGGRPHLDIELVHKVGNEERVSILNAMASTAGAGHGRTAAFVILDEFSRHPYAREAYKAVVPAQGGSKKAKGKTAIISTANGISTDEESGNFYHHLYTNAEHYGIRTRFLRWDQNPDRDDEWYDAVPRKLPAKDRGEQYPQNAQEAFILTGDVAFDVEALQWYAENAVLAPLYRCDFEIGPKPSQARLLKREFGPLAVLQEPVKGRSYAIFADVATGRGKDFSAAYVIDLSTMELAAEYHGKLDADLYAAKLHFLGRWYNDARIAPEMGGGYGEPVVIALRDGRDGRPPYPKLYRHHQGSAVTRKTHANYGFPMNTKTRPQVINQLEKAIREHTLPYMTEGLLQECRTFVHHDTNPSPRAQEGTNDDRVMAAAGVLELYRQYGVHQGRYVPKRPAATEPPEILRDRRGTLDPRILERRYPRGSGA